VYFESPSVQVCSTYHPVAPNINLKPTVAMELTVDGKEEKCMSFSGNSEGTDCLEHQHRDELILKCTVNRMGAHGQDSCVVECTLTQH
jgi:hypothetical protein